jgi:hypothetical protein
MVTLLVRGDGMSIVVGDDCLLMRGHALRTADLPAVVDRRPGRASTRPARWCSPTASSSAPAPASSPA